MFLLQIVGAALVTAVWLSAAPKVVGDGPSRGRIVAPGDHFLPGATLEVTGAGLDEGVELVLTLTKGDAVAELGTATVGLDQTFATTITIPTSFPLGYAELEATDPIGNSWSVVVLIGERAEGPDGAGQVSFDERTVGVLAFTIGLAIFLAAVVWYVRGRPKQTL